jgi:hypothetical protein
MLQLLKVCPLKESLSQAKEKEGETQGISCQRKGTYKEVLRRTKETSSSEGNNTLLSSCTYLVCIIFVHILYIYLLEDNVFQEELYRWKKKKIRIDIIR